MAMGMKMREGELVKLKAERRHHHHLHIYKSPRSNSFELVRRLRREKYRDGPDAIEYGTNVVHSFCSSGQQHS